MEDNMLRWFTKAALAAVAPTIGTHGRHCFLTALVLIGASSLAPSGAHAELKPVFDKLLLYNSPATLPTIEVEAEGKDWTRVRTETLHVRTSYYVSLEKGDISIIIASPSPEISQSRSPDGGKRRWGEFSFQLTNENFGNRAILACNREKESGADTSGTHTTYVDLGFKLFVTATRAGNFADRSVDGQVQAKVICKKAPKLVEISHFAVKLDDTSDSCPKKAVVQVGFSTNRNDRIDFTLAHMNAGTLSTSEHFVQPFQIGGQFTATKLIDLVVDSNTAYVEIGLKDGSDSRRWRPLDPQGISCPRALKVTSLWLIYDVENEDTCPKKVREKVTGKATAPGKAPFEIKTQTGLVVHSGMADFKLKGTEYVAEFGRDKLAFNNAFESEMMAQIKSQPSANSGWVRLKVDCLEALSGKLTLQSLGATSCKGEALVAIHTNGTGELPYELECGPGKSWQRKVTVTANKIGVDKVRFDVTNNEQVTCVLRTRIGGALKSLDGASKTFQCHKPIDTGTSDFTPELPPGNPPVVGPTLTGDFSFVDTGGTRCPRQGKALINFETSKPNNVHWSLDCTTGQFSGVAQTTPSPQGGFIGPGLASFAVNQTTHAKCALKTVAPGKPKVHALKGHLFQCAGRAGVGGPEDLTPETPSDSQKPGTAIVDPVKPESPDGPEGHTATVSDPKISCANGLVKNGACDCEPHFKPVKAGKNAWRCERSTVDPRPEKPIVSESKIVCAVGTVKNGACTCARTHKLVKKGRNAWSCVKVVVDPPRNKDKLEAISDKAKVGVKTAPKKMAPPKLGTAGKARGGKGNGKTAKKGRGSSATP
jgi:hypothetical protein